VYRDTKLCGVSIHPGHLLIVDRAATAADGDLVVVEFDDELTVRRLEAGAEGQLFGKVLHVIHSLDAGAPGEESDEWSEVINE